MRKRRAGSGIEEIDEKIGGGGPLVSLIVLFFLIVGNGVIYNSWKWCMCNILIIVCFTVL